MREFLKLIVSILVILVITYTLYFFLYNDAKYQENHLSGEGYISGEENNSEVTINTNKEFAENNSISNNEESENENQNVKENNQKLNPNEILQESGDVLIEKIETLSGNPITTKDLEKNIAKINLIETKNNLANLTKSIEDKVGVNIVGIKNQDYMDSISENKVDVTIQVAGSMIYIIPMSDFVDNAQYHYDTNGELALYVCEIAGIGGEIRYYFENDSLLTQVANVEKEMQLNYESVEEILERAKLVYSKYMK